MQFIHIQNLAGMEIQGGGVLHHSLCTLGVCAASEIARKKAGVSGKVSNSFCFQLLALSLAETKARALLLNSTTHVIRHDFHIY